MEITARRTKIGSRLLKRQKVIEMKNRVVQIWMFLLLATAGISQDISFTTKVSANKVGVSDKFQVTYSSNKQGTFIPPKFKDFNQLGGVSQGSNSSVSIVNGQMSQSVTYNYSIVLQPKKIGDFTVEGAQIKVGKATYESKSAKVTVVAESQARQRTRQRSIFDQMDDMMRGFPQYQQRQIEITDQDLFARISVSKGSVKKGEGLLATYKIYARNFNFGLEKYDFPTQENFWTENIKIPEDIKPTQETVNGVRYQVYTLKKELLFPQTSGELKLNKFGITARIQTSPFSQPISKTISSNSPVIKVESLSNNAPESFVNQVGTFTMKVESTSDTIQINEPIDYKIIISGKGNLKQMNQLTIDFPEELEVYDPEIDNKISVSESGVKGSKSFNYLLIPRESGTFTLPEVSFTYFDLSTNSYKTLNHPAKKVTVVNPDGSVNPEIEVEAKDSESEKEPNTISFDLSYLWMGLSALGAIGLGIILFLFLGKRKNKEETEETRRKNARKKLAQKLAVAKSHLENNQVSEFYSEILIGLNKYVNEKLGIETSNMTKHTIRETLDNKGVGENTINSFVTVLEQCEMAKYAPLTNQNNQEIYEKSLDVIEEIEGQMK